MIIADELFGTPLPNGCRITHGDGANIRRPFGSIPLVMHEVHGGVTDGQQSGFRGQFGFAPFRSDFRMPRHVHMAVGESSDRHRFVSERILVLNGVGLVELAGQLYVAPCDCLVDIGPGVPHAWTACPPGVRLPDGSVSDGTFLMIYEYSEPTRFFPVENTAPLADPAEYQAFSGDAETLRVPVLNAEQVAQAAALVWDREIRHDLMHLLAA